MRIAFYPEIRKHTAKQNIYTVKIQNILEELGEVYPLEDLIKKPLNFFKTDYLYLNWFENLFFKPESVFVSRMECFAKLVLLSVCKLLGMKILVVFHNKVPHSIDIHSDVYKKVFKKFFTKYLKLANKVIVLSKSSSSFLTEIYKCDASKITYVPHGNYIGEYKFNEDCIRQNNKEIVVGYVGRINKYKKVLEIVNAFSKHSFENMNLHIEGGINDQGYETALRNASNENATLVFNDISDDDLIDTLHKLDVLILPYHPDEALNSGLVFLAMSHHVIVACTPIGTVLDMSDDLYFRIECEDYSDSEQLEKGIQNALINISNNKDRIDEMKEKAYEYVKTNHDWNVAKDCLKDMFNN